MIYFVLMQINRLLPIIRFGHMHYKNCLIFYFNRIYIVCRQDITAHLLRIIELAAEFFHYFSNIMKTYNLKLIRQSFIIMFEHAKNNPPSMCVGKRRISRPHIFWKSFSTFFKFNIYILALGKHIYNFLSCKIFHIN